MTAPHNAPQSAVADIAPQGADWAGDARRPISLIEAMGIARRSVEQLTSLRVDAVARTDRAPDGGWAVTIDVVEAKARMGNNDLLCAYEVSLAPDGELTGFGRRHRYLRETGSPE
jgi:hypothetical protein